MLFRSHRLAETVQDLLQQVLLGLIQFEACRRRGPHQIAAAFPKFRRLGRGAADGGALHPGTAGIAGFGDTIDQDRFLSSLGAACKMQHRSGWPFFGHDFFLQDHQCLFYGFRPRWAARYVDVHGQNLIDALDHAVAVVHAAAVGAGPHGDHPLGFGHLLIEP